MGVEVAALPISALVALILAAVLIGAGVFAYRHAYVRSRAALVAMAITIALLAVWRMAPGIDRTPGPATAEPVLDEAE